MNVDPVQIIIGKLESGGFNPRPTGPDKWESRCPAHNGSRRNLSIRRGDDGRALISCHHAGEGVRGCDYRTIVQALGLSVTDLFPPGEDSSPRANRKGKTSREPEGNPRAYPTPEAAIEGVSRRLGKPSTFWSYQDRKGAEVFRVYRFDGSEGKDYRPVHSGPEGWRIGDPAGLLPLYHLPELAPAPVVFVTEGEKCADLTRNLGLISTTSSHGAQSAHKTDWTPLAGKTVVILPDAGPEGERYAQAVTGLLAKLEPKPVVRVVKLPVSNDGDDIEEWLTKVVPDGWEPEQCRAELERLANAVPTEGIGAGIETSDPGEASEAPGPAVREWPAPPTASAFAGLAGDIVRTIEPHTEADPVAILVQLLVGFGNVIGRSAHFAVEADLHYGNEFAAMVGDTSKGRKGTSWGHARRMLESIDPEWVNSRLLGGLSTGEGLIHAVRDAVTARQPIREKKKITGYEDVEVDPGEPDKRLLCIEAELGGTLRVAMREGNTLSALVRQAWDTGGLRTLTRNNPLKATGAHISIIGHITHEELARLLTKTEAANGFANRFLWVAVRRSKSLPFGGSIDQVDFAPLGGRLQAAAFSARAVGRVRRDADADKLWADAYETLSEGGAGLLGAVTSRAEAHVTRLAMIYALLDQSPVIRADHLRSALSLWDYSARSAAFIFGATLGDPDADALLDAIRLASEGLTRTEIRERVFQRNKSSERIAQMLSLLSRAGLAHSRTEATGGRPAERWFAGRGKTR